MAKHVVATIIRLDKSKAALVPAASDPRELPAFVSSPALVTPRRGAGAGAGAPGVVVAHAVQMPPG